MDSQLPTLPKVPSELEMAAAAGQLVVFVGAGISRLIDCPSWNGFADRVVDQLVPESIDHYVLSQINNIADPRKRLSIAEIIADKTRKSIDYPAIFEVKRDGTDVYTFLNQFRCTFVTTNYEKYLQPEESRGRPESEWRFFRISRLLTTALDRSGNVIHLHGCMDDRASMVVTTRDYLSHYSQPVVQEFLRYLFQQKTVLFLGYGLEETEVLEYILKRGEAESDSSSGFQKRFILQGFFRAEAQLRNLLADYYRDSFATTLIGFERDQKDYALQTDILSDWCTHLRFAPMAHADQLALMEDEIND